jgi:hypothetical protein
MKQNKIEKEMIQQIKKRTMNWDGRILGMIQKNRERNDGTKNEHLALSWDGSVLGTKYKKE